MHSADARAWNLRLIRWAEGFSRHWMLFFSLGYGLYVGLPWLAPVFMKWGWEAPARWIYAAYALVCHQLPQRSFFLFGPKWMYNLPEIQAVWLPTNDPLLLRQFIGNPAMGWKVAWSDRMVSWYTSILLWAWVWWPLRRRWRPLSLRAFLLLLLPIALDGGTHMLSDLTGGIGVGFRYTNEWLAVLTRHALPVSFYVGDALGSFNSWMRLLTGVLAGLAVVGFFFPRLEAYFAEYAALMARKRQRALERA